jgi:Lon protease-like protein
MTGPLPIFPLPSVLFPHAALPLQVFERRYLEMMDRVLAGERRFGVVLIERGSSVGGGDTRFDVGTMARVVRVGALDEGRLAVVALGEERIRVVDWLPDDPYPEATVTVLDGSRPGPSTAELIEAARRGYRRAMSLASELGGRMADPDPGLPNDPIVAAWFLCDAAPIEQLDRQRLLEIDDVDSRLETLIVELDDKAELLRARLGRS